MSERMATVLFADVSGSTKLYETAGDATALAAITLCLAAMRQATEAAGGRVVKTIGDEVMAVFPGPDAAVAAAAEMQAKAEALPEVAGTRIGLRIGFHYGPVLQQDNDVFGDTVNLAARLVAQAQKSEIITTSETAAQLAPVFRSMVRHLHSITVRGKTEEVEVAEIVWRSDVNATTFVRNRVKPKAAGHSVRLRYRNREVVRRRDGDAVIIGRDAGCGLVIDDDMASRQHCTVERRGDKFILKDHSTNGTYVTLEGDTEILLQREELTLRRHGWIAFGQPRAGTAEVVEFLCD
ncbi:MAG: adenylate/guanylate cyclase domain-containing protein [Burkholderiales bacterium]